MEKTKTQSILKRVSFQQFLFLGKPPYVRYLCRGVVPLPGGGILLRLPYAGRKSFWLSFQIADHPGVIALWLESNAETTSTSPVGLLTGWGRRGGGQQHRESYGNSRSSA
jgi:hypothetical protein